MTEGEAIPQFRGAAKLQSPHIIKCTSVAVLGPAAPASCARSNFLSLDQSWSIYARIHDCKATCKPSDWTNKHPPREIIRSRPAYAASPARQLIQTEVSRSCSTQARVSTANGDANMSPERILHVTGVRKQEDPRLATFIPNLRKTRAGNPTCILRF